MKPDDASQLKAGELVVLYDESAFTLHLWSSPGTVDKDLNNIMSSVVGEVACGSLALVLSVVNLREGGLPDEPYEVLVLAEDNLGWVFASFVFLIKDTPAWL